LVKNYIKSRNDIEVIFVNYNRILLKKAVQARRIYNFIDYMDISINEIVAIIDEKLNRESIDLPL